LHYAYEEIAEQVKGLITTHASGRSRPGKPRERKVVSDGGYRRYVAGAGDRGLAYEGLKFSERVPSSRAPPFGHYRLLARAQDTRGSVVGKAPAFVGARYENVAFWAQHAKDFGGGLIVGRNVFEDVEQRHGVKGLVAKRESGRVSTDEACSRPLVVTRMG
jgi:hypothetical protein